MDDIGTIILGGGLSGLSLAYHMDSNDWAILEKEDSLGGKLRTVRRDGFIWDYAGHFLHFTDQNVESEIREILDDDLLTVKKRSHIHYQGELVDYPFQKNIHQLPKDEFLNCLHDLYFRPSIDYDTFSEMLLSKFGESICELFMFPYNKKLYSCDLDTLGPELFGKFFPDPDFEDVIRNFKEQTDESYNAEFVYPESGIDSLITALLRNVNGDNVFTEQEVIEVRLNEKVVRTPSRKYSYDRLVSTIPLPDLLRVANRNPNAGSSPLNANKILVLNLGFDRDTDITSHWIYFPNESINFHRVGFYNNIRDSNRMSLFVEIGFNSSESIDVESEKEKALESLSRVGIVQDHELVAEHNVILNPAYCYLNSESTEFVSSVESWLESRNAYLLGRYAKWIYCSVEDNFYSAKCLANEMP